MQVRRPVSGQPIVSVSKPGEIIHAPKTEIARADAPAGE
jgi:hypothetical protein